MNFDRQFTVPEATDRNEMQLYLSFGFTAELMLLLYLFISTCGSLYCYLSVVGERDANDSR